MLKITKCKTTSLVVLLIAAFAITSLAGLQFVPNVTAAGYTETIGTLDGVPFVVRFPDNWNGRLVVCCRGYSTTPVLDPRTAFYITSAPDFLNRGYAYAASIFAPTGFCIQQGVNSTYQLTKYLVDTYRITGKVFLFGASMGGAVALLLGEKYPNLYSCVLELYGMKDLKDQYQRTARWANLSDAELTAELAALNSSVPPLSSGKPVGGNLTGYRAFLVSSVVAFENETGGTPATKPKAYEDDSPTYHANISIPVITIAGTSDAIVPYYESQMYQTAVANAGRSSLYRLYPVVNGTHGSLAVGLQAAARFDELVALSDQIGEYRGWKVVPFNGRIYVIPPPSATGVVWPQQIGTWDAEYYGKLGKTMVDAAKPAIDECISNCGSKYPTP